mmetsp:Transcript_24602/g.54170  ORF Transcript_24602/g.54170 Transcript_24602/m.54170 type:complete len:172 (-) Transcript_24602:278-793(-)
MLSSSPSSMMTTTSRRSGSADHIPNLPSGMISNDSNSRDSNYFKMASKITSASSSLTSRIRANSAMDSDGISEPTTPSLRTPEPRSTFTNPHIKNVHYLDIEMRSKKRRRRCVDGNAIDCYLYNATSLIEKIGLPALIPLEACCDSHETCLPDTSFLLQKKPLRRRRGIVS